MTDYFIVQESIDPYFKGIKIDYLQSAFKKLLMKFPSVEDMWIEELDRDQGYILKGKVKKDAARLLLDASDLKVQIKHREESIRKANNELDKQKIILQDLEKRIAEFK